MDLIDRSKKFLESVGNTPIIKIDEVISCRGAGVHAVLEYENPGGSHKDRPVALMIYEKVCRDEIKEGDTVVDYTTGSLGNSVAVMNITAERENLIRANRAELVLTPPDGADDVPDHQKWIRGAVEKAIEICRQPRHILLNQSANPENNHAFHGLALEILNHFSHVDYVVAASGASATIVGLGEVFKKLSPHTKMVAVDVSKSASTWALKYGQTFTHQPHRLFGTGAGAASPIAQRGIKFIDEVHCVDDEHAYEVCRELGKSGLAVGPTSGANVIVVREILKKDPTACVVVIFHDRADRYRSVGL